MKTIEEKLQYTFSDKKLLREALTHSSYVNENGGTHNERLEFLGDSVLHLVSTGFLFNTYSEESEGVLSAYRARLVSTDTLSLAADDIELGDHLFISKGSKREGRGWFTMKADALEAIIGGIYMDGGFLPAKNFITTFILSKLEAILKNEEWIDAKTRLQEKIQGSGGATPSYNTEQVSGTEHSPIFSSTVLFGDKEMATAKGYSKQRAEQAVAEKALEKIE